MALADGHRGFLETWNASSQRPRRPRRDKRTRGNLRVACHGYLVLYQLYLSRPGHFVHSGARWGIRCVLLPLNLTWPPFSLLLSKVTSCFLCSCCALPFFSIVSMLFLSFLSIFPHFVVMTRCVDLLFLHSLSPFLPLSYLVSPFFHSSAPIGVIACRLSPVVRCVKARSGLFFLFFFFDLGAKN